MEFTFAYFTLIKFSIVAIALLTAFKLYRLNHRKSALTIIIILTLVGIFIPIHYNGTESDTYHNTNEYQVTDKYEEVNTTPVHTDKPTFNEVLLEEANYYKTQNNELHKELK